MRDWKDHVHTRRISFSNNPSTFFSVLSIIVSGSFVFPGISSGNVEVVNSCILVADLYV